MIYDYGTLFQYILTTITDPIYHYKNQHMKKVYFILAALAITAAVMAQATPAEKRDLRNDIAKERIKRHEVARDVLRGEPEKARADHNAAVAYHKDIHRDVRQIHHREAVRARNHPHVVVVRHHYYHHPRHHRHYVHHRRRTVVVIHN
jgi:hypothetical protein